MGIETVEDLPVSRKQQSWQWLVALAGRRRREGSGINRLSGCLLNIYRRVLADYSVYLWLKYDDSLELFVKRTVRVPVKHAVSHRPDRHIPDFPTMCVSWFLPARLYGHWIIDLGGFEGKQFNRI